MVVEVGTTEPEAETPVTTVVETRETETEIRRFPRVPASSPSSSRGYPQDLMKCGIMESYAIANYFVAT